MIFLETIRIAGEEAEAKHEKLDQEVTKHVDEKEKRRREEGEVPSDEEEREAKVRNEQICFTGTKDLAKMNIEDSRAYLFDLNIRASRAFLSHLNIEDSRAYLLHISV